MRYPFFFLLLLCCHSGFAQESFDYHRDFKKIAAESLDSKSRNYYPALFERYNRNDSTLTNNDMLALMIGVTEKKGYLPYESTPAEDNIKDLIREKQFGQAIDSCNKLLLSYPLNFTATMEKSFAYMKLKNDSASFYKERFMKIIRAVRASGDGSRAHPYFILGPEDGQTLITHVLGGQIGMMGSGKDDHGYFLDMIERKEEGKETQYLFFIIEHATKKGIGHDIDKAAEKMKMDSQIITNEPLEKVK